MKTIPVELKQFFLDVELLIKNKSFKQARSVLLKNSSDKYKNYYLYFFYMGLIYKSEKNFNQAIENFKKSILKNNAFVLGYINIAELYDKTKQYFNAVNYLTKAFKLKNDDSRIIYLLARGLKKNSDFEKALIYCNKLNSDFKKKEVLFLKAECYQSLHQQSLAIENLECYIKLNNKNKEAYINLGSLYMNKDNIKALKYFGLAQKIDPLDLRPYYKTAYLVKDERKKISFLDRAFRVSKSKNLNIFIEILINKRIICDWSFHSHSYNDLNLMVQKKAIPNPLGAFYLNDDFETHYKIAKKKANLIASTVKQKNIKFNHKNKKIKIGYVSADFKAHAVSYLISPLWRHSDKDKFEIYAYSLFGNNNKDLKRRFFQKYSNFFFDVGELRTQDIVNKIMSDKIDILVDLGGHTKNHRPDIFFHKPAPICINYLGYPGTMGSNVYDYIISDINTIPKENTKFVSEKIIYFPHTYFIFDETLEYKKNVNRSNYGLPDDKILLCAYHNSTKIGPNEFDIWMRILKNNNNTVLVLKEKKKYVKENLRIEAKKRNVDPKRLFFIGFIEHQLHIASYKIFDIFLDCFYYNAHSTALEALFMGLPIITKIGNNIASRSASGILKALELKFLICQTEEEYENKIQYYIDKPDELKKLKSIVKMNKKKFSLFDSVQTVKRFEKAYKIIYENYHSGGKTKNTYIK